MGAEVKIEHGADDWPGYGPNGDNRHVIAGQQAPAACPSDARNRERGNGFYKEVACFGLNVADIAEVRSNGWLERSFSTCDYITFFLTV
jgi:hypothetical protein